MGGNQFVDAKYMRINQAVSTKNNTYTVDTAKVSQLLMQKINALRSTPYMSNIEVQNFANQRSETMIEGPWRDMQQIADFDQAIPNLSKQSNGFNAGNEYAVTTKVGANDEQTANAIFNSMQDNYRMVGEFENGGRLVKFDLVNANQAHPYGAVSVRYYKGALYSVFEEVNPNN